MGDLQNPIATITNNSSIDVDVYDVFDPSGGGGAVLSYTKLGTVKQGQTQPLQTLHLASQLQAMYTGVVAALNGNYYYQFPVAVMPIIAIGTKKTTSYTITDADKTAMEQSFLFQKYVVANADSQIAKSFFAALNDPNQEAAVNKFFASTKNFSGCTMASWTAVVSWCGQFTCAWQGPYYLYSVPAQGSTAPPALIATVNIGATATVDVAILAMNNSSQTTNLAMNGQGLQEADVGEGGISASLKPAWINVVQTDAGGGVSYLIGNALSGVVNGVTVAGTGEKRVIPDPNAPPDQQSKQQQSQLSFDSVFNKVIALIGLGVSMLTAYLFYKQLKTGHTQKSNTSAEDVAKKPDSDDGSVDKEIEKVDKEYESKFVDEDGEVPLTRKRVAKVPEEMKEAVKEVTEQEKVNTLENVVDEQVDKLTETLETKAPTNDLETAAAKLSDIQENINDIQSGSTNAKSLDEVTSELKDASATIKTQSQSNDWKDYERESLESAKEAIDSGVQQTESIDKTQAEKDKQNEEAADETEISNEEFEEPDSMPIDPVGD